MNKLTALLPLLLLSACAVSEKEVATGPGLEVRNLYSNAAFDYRQIKNVLLLPIDNPMQDKQVALYEESLVRSVIRSFSQEGFFNLNYDRSISKLQHPILDLDTSQMDHLRAGELGRQRNADALLQISVVELRSFLPMRLHVKAALVETQTAQRIWSFDQVFDAAESSVVNGMREWYNSHRAGGREGTDFQMALGQPTEFMNYAFSTLTKSLEAEREASLKARKKV